MLNEYKRILVPIDGSKLSEAAAFKAAEVALRNDGRLDLLTVINTTNNGFTYGLVSGDAIKQVVDDQVKYLQDLVARIKKETGIEDIHMHVRFGSPRNVITYDFPADYDIDLIMMGATGKGAMKRMLVGSVSSFVNSHANCDVIVVRTGLDNQPVAKK